LNFVDLKDGKRTGGKRKQLQERNGEKEEEMELRGSEVTN